MEDAEIKPFITLFAAAKELGVDPKVVKGLCLGLKVEMMRVHPKLIVIRRADIDRLRKRLEDEEINACVS